MLASRESVSEFIKAKVASDCAGITSPEMRFHACPTNQPPEFPNVLNLYFYDDNNVQPGISYPAWRECIASFELLIEVDPSAPMLAETQAIRVMQKISNFMAVQAIDKLDYSVVPPVPMGTQIEWSQSYPVEWRDSADTSERYIHKTAAILFRYFEEKFVI